MLNINDVPKNENEIINDWNNCYLNTIYKTFEKFYGIKKYKDI
jgi:hypothetical protein